MNQMSMVLRKKWFISDIPCIKNSKKKKLKENPDE